MEATRRAVAAGSWSSLGPSARGEFLWRLADGIEANAAVFTELEILDNGMPLNPAGVVGQIIP